MVAEAVVDHLETVEVDEHHRQMPALAVEPRPGEVQALLQVSAVGQPGQRIVGVFVEQLGIGVVEFAGEQRGYGNVIYIKHRSNQMTVYAHLSRIGVNKGQRVEQGQTIGAVGSTGASTGPHLHFEFKVAGQHQDPLNIARSSEGQPIAAGSRKAFAEVAGAMRLKLASAATVVQASAD